MNSKTFKRVIIGIVILALCISAYFLLQDKGKNVNTLNTESALRQLDDLYSRVMVIKQTPRKDADFVANDENAELLAVLPDISEYPFIVNPTTSNFLTIYASPEKANWLVNVAKKFNDSEIKINGQPISVGIRAVQSNLAADFISSGKYSPDLLIPTSEIYGDLLMAQGAKATLIEKRLVGNVSGVVITKNKNDELIKKNGSITVQNIIDSVLGGSLALGYVSPTNHEDGFNFILTLLSTSDSANPLSDGAIATLRKVQDKIPFVSYDNEQLKSSLNGGTLDAIILNYQEYASSTLKQFYQFAPIGVRQDSPVYEIGDLSELKKQISAKFVDFCKSADSQKVAKDAGFNNLEEYSYVNTLNGVTIDQAQEIYKKEKNGSSDLTAVFIADISGSMEGSPILNLKAGLNRLISAISPNVNVGFVTFSDDVTINVPIAKFDNTQRAYFSNSVKSLSTVGSTALFDAVVVGERMLMDAKLRNPNTKLVLIVLSDGEPNRGLKFEEIEKVTRSLKVPVCTIGYNANLDVLKQLSDINEAPALDADSENIIHRLESLFNSQM
jgi:Ca-activated chloride channel family protein